MLVALPHENEKSEGKRGKTQMVEGTVQNEKRKRNTIAMVKWRKYDRHRYIAVTTEQCQGRRQQEQPTGLLIPQCTMD